MATPPEGFSPPQTCFAHGDTDDPEHFRWAPSKKHKVGGRWVCRKYQSEASKRSSERIPHQAKYRYYVYADKERFGGGTLSWEDASALMDLPCVYCGLEVSDGLDRRDNSFGHSLENVVPCCSVCNGIFVDLPLEVKDLIAPGLREARQKGLLDTWVPPAHRRK